MSTSGLNEKHSCMWSELQVSLRIKSRWLSTVYLTIEDDRKLFLNLVVSKLPPQLVVIALVDHQEGWVHRVLPWTKAPFWAPFLKSRLQRQWWIQRRKDREEDKKTKKRQLQRFTWGELLNRWGPSLELFSGPFSFSDPRWSVSSGFGFSFGPFLLSFDTILSCLKITSYKFVLHRQTYKYTENCVRIIWIQISTCASILKENLGVAQCIPVCTASFMASHCVKGTFTWVENQIWNSTALWHGKNSPAPFDIFFLK